MKQKFLLIFLLFPSLCFSELGVIEVRKDICEILTLDGAVKEALSRKPSVLAYRYSVEDYRNQQIATLSSYMPNVSASETAYVTAGTRNSIGIEYSQTIFDVPKINSYKKAGVNVAYQRHQKEYHEDNVRLSTETVFLSSWLLQNKQDLISSLNKSTNDTFEYDKNRELVGLISKDDWLKAKYSYSNNISAVKSFQDDLREYEKTLEYYVGLSLALVYNENIVGTFTKLDWDYERKFVLNSFQNYYEKALRNRKDLKSKKDLIDIERYNSAYYLSQHLPTASVFGSAVRSNVSSSGSSTAESAGIKFSLSIFDGFSRYFNKSAADAKKMQAILNRNDIIQQIKYEVQKAHSAYEKELNTLEAQRDSFEQSKNEFKLKKLKYEIGTISKVDFEIAKYNWENAFHAWITQVAVTAQKERELLYYCGYPSEYN